MDPVLPAVWAEAKSEIQDQDTFRERRLHPVLLIRGGLALRQLLKIAFSALRASIEGNYYKVWLAVTHLSNKDPSSCIKIFFP